MDPAPSSCDSLSYAFVGWPETSAGDNIVRYLFDPSTIRTISEQITRALAGVDPLGRNIVIPDDKICNVLSSVYREGTRTEIGDIHSRYVIPQKQARCDERDIINQTINIITSYIRNDVGITENNKKLTVWTTVLGDFNEAGLRSHPIIYTREKHPQYMAFNMRY